MVIYICNKTTGSYVKYYQVKIKNLKETLTKVSFEKRLILFNKLVNCINLVSTNEKQLNKLINSCVNKKYINTKSVIDFYNELQGEELKQKNLILKD